MTRTQVMKDLNEFTKGAIFIGRRDAAKFMKCRKETASKMFDDLPIPPTQENKKYPKAYIGDLADKICGKM